MHCTFYNTPAIYSFCLDTFSAYVTVFIIMDVKKQKKKKKEKKRKKKQCNGFYHLLIMYVQILSLCHLLPWK